MPDLFQLIFRRRMDALKGIPGPKPSFPIGNLSQFIGTGQPWEVCARLASEYGGMTLVWMFGSPAIVLNDPKLIEEVLCSKWEDYYKQAPCDALRPVITRKSLFISNPPQWRPAREGDALQIPHIDQWLVSLVTPVRRTLASSIDALAEKSKTSPIDLYEDIQRLSFDAFSTAFWGRTLEPKYYDWFRTLGDVGSKRMMSTLPKIPPLNPRFYRHRRNWYENFTELVRTARRGDAGAATGLLHLAVTNGNRLSDADLAQSLATNFFGGVYSCSSTIITALYLLAKHPEEQSKLLSALQTDLSTEFNFMQLSNCQQLDFVMREAMRYYPAVPIYFRNSSKSKEVTLGDHLLPKNTLIFISNWWLHKMAPHWDTPDEFRPERWSHGMVHQNPIGSGYFFPFGRGPRMCIGANFSVFFIKMAIASLFSDVRVEIDASQEYKQSFYFGVMIPQGLKAHFTKRPTA